MNEDDNIRYYACNIGLLLLAVAYVWMLIVRTWP